MDALKAEIVSLIAKQKTTVEWVIPYDKGGLLNRIHDAGQVLEQSYEGDGVHIRAVLEQTECERFLRELNK